MRFLRCILVLVGFSPVVTLAQSKAAAAAEEEEAPSLDQLYEAGKSLFDQLAPAEIKEQYEFPSKEQWDSFAARLQQALQSDDPAELVAYEQEARTALAALRVLPGYEEYADWLQERIDYIEASRQAGTPTPKPAPQPTQIPPKTSPAPPPTNKPATVKPALPTVSETSMPHYELWLDRMRSRALPAQAGELMPILKAAFEAEGIPAEIAWLAEVESTLNPAARSPAGAKGLFQLMPATAKSLGLSTYLPDERANVEKSAQAAAKYLKTLHGKFGD